MASAGHLIYGFMGSTTSLGTQFSPVAGSHCWLDPHTAVLRPTALNPGEQCKLQRSPTNVLPETQFTGRIVPWSGRFSRGHDKAVEKNSIIIINLITISYSSF